MNIFEVLKAGNSALEVGKEVANARVWADKAVLTDKLGKLIAVLLVGSSSVAAAFGYDLRLEGADAYAISGGIAATMLIFQSISGFLHRASNPNSK